jgi:hypothetical protein
MGNKPVFKGKYPIDVDYKHYFYTFSKDGSCKKHNRLTRRSTVIGKLKREPGYYYYVNSDGTIGGDKMPNYNAIMKNKKKKSRSRSR